MRESLLAWLDVSNFEGLLCFTKSFSIAWCLDISNDSLNSNNDVTYTKSFSLTLDSVSLELNSS